MITLAGLEPRWATLVGLGEDLVNSPSPGVASGLEAAWRAVSAVPKPPKTTFQMERFMASAHDGAQDGAAAAHQRAR